MPQVTIKTGIVDTNGQEVVLTEYLCDWPECVNTAEHVVGVALEVAMATAVCREHAAMLRKRESNFPAD